MVRSGSLIIATLVAWLAPVRATEAPAQFEPHVLACAPCHGAQGQGTGDPYFPRLAGKPAGYLFNQLAAFKSGRRKYPPMNYLLEYQNDAFLEQIAAYFAAQKPPLPEPAVADVSEAVLARGKSLVTQGDFDKGIPACASCHGPLFTGMEPAIPGLVGLKASYISAQLGAWRYGIRTAAVARLHATRRRASNRRRRQGHCGLVVLATGAVGSLTGRQGKLPAAVRLRQRTKLRSRQSGDTSSRGSPIHLPRRRSRCGCGVAVPRGGGRRAGAARSRDGRARRVSGPRGGLRVVSHGPRRKTVRRRPRHEHAVRDDIHDKPHPRPRTWDREMDGRSVLSCGSHGSGARRRSLLSRHAVWLFYKGHAGG